MTEASEKGTEKQGRLKVDLAIFQAIPDQLIFGGFGGLGLLVFWNKGRQRGRREEEAEQRGFRSPPSILEVVLPKKYLLKVGFAQSIEINPTVDIVLDIAFSKDLKKFLGVC
ncbi:hypothetical protein COLO4_05293 [Corchorus olitorius]|uniref:Uncharacterized protein n=1 Tax=Corchorus olitorius TaxID=93759 RepID=A0A1R3KRB2_9ROSI|nr:hypothetical protein COLO4_05293 [Corchorus olitorius]